MRFVGGAWEAIDPTESASQSVRVKSVGQILGISGSAVFLFSDDPDFGFRFVDDLLDPVENSASDLALWEAADVRCIFDREMGQILRPNNSACID